MANTATAIEDGDDVDERDDSGSYSEAGVRRARQGGAGGSAEGSGGSADGSGADKARCLSTGGIGVDRCGIHARTP